MGRFPSGQREQTVNLPSQTSMVRIHPCPPKPFSLPRRHILREWRNWQTRMIQVHVFVRTCRFKSCFPHQNPETTMVSGFSLSIFPFPISSVFPRLLPFLHLLEVKTGGRIWGPAAAHAVHHGRSRRIKAIMAPKNTEEKSPVDCTRKNGQ